jgi:hypothetical protein
MIFRFLIKTVTPAVVGSLLVGWASLGGTPAARTLKAAAFGSARCTSSCKHGAGPAVSQPPKPKTKPVVVKADAKHASARHPPRALGGAP